MTGILVVTHGKFSKEIIESAELIVGKQENITYLTLEHDDSVEELRSKVYESINLLERGDGVLVLADLFGGSPSNVIASNLKHLNFECITGINLPMLIEALVSRNTCSLSELVEKCMTSGNEGIQNLKEMLCARINQ
ncbi:PTS sugar transporter subunit IIA [Irregularibacter muris]|uniref:PTS sugar transporter subunit IIA n=2 Tax=Irregularibacter muris TaxID=1796619 RepID=A0AAE3HDX5_9FIRM|nr:PTS sugar transporter subunit IIA [Irregularibacter muris]